MTPARPDNEHTAVDELLPWYVNDTLDAAERARVDMHVRDCARCRENAEFLTDVQAVVQTDSPAPLVPQADVDGLLATIEQGDVPRRNSRNVGYLAVAASLFAVAVIAPALVDRSGVSDEQAKQFETVISPSASNTMQYIVELRFVAATSPAERLEILDTMGGAVSSEPSDADRITLHVESGSFSELQRRIDDLRSLPQVSAAEIVAVHVPVE